MNQASVFVRLLDAQWEGQLAEPLHSRAAQRQCRTPAWLSDRQRADMLANAKSRTYREAALPRGRALPPTFTEAMEGAILAGLGLASPEDAEGWADMNQ